MIAVVTVDRAPPTEARAVTFDLCSPSGHLGRPHQQPASTGSGLMMDGNKQERFTLWIKGKNMVMGRCAQWQSHTNIQKIHDSTIKGRTRLRMFISFVIGLYDNDPCLCFSQANIYQTRPNVRRPSREDGDLFACLILLLVLDTLLTTFNILFINDDLLNHELYSDLYFLC